jgi:hypothetical protein
MKTIINRNQDSFAIPPAALRGSFIGVALTALLVPAMPLSAATADDGLSPSTRLHTSTESTAAQQTAKGLQRGVLGGSGKPSCAELGNIAQLPALTTRINGEFAGIVGCGNNGVYADAAPGTGAGALSENVATEVIWHLQWRTWFAYCAPEPVMDCRQNSSVPRTGFG